MFFKILDSEEDKSYRKWARDNYKVGEPISGVWHPAVQDECVKINVENSSLAASILHNCQMYSPDTCPACRIIQRNID